jgi:ATP-dependent exoDNAse (exonuclease V) beta subunit
LGFAASAAPEAVRAHAARLVRPEETDETLDVGRQVDAAVAAYLSICAREDIRELYHSGTTLHEVPFTMLVDGGFVRGTVDCLIQLPSGHLTVLEFKTGKARPEHRDQADLYVRAMRRVFPQCVVEARLVYTETASTP